MNEARSEGDRVGDVLDRAQALDRLARQRVGAQHVVGGQAANQRRFDQARGDGVGGDVELALFQRQRAGEADQAGLGGRVVGLAGVAPVRARGDVDHAAPLSFHHGGQGRPGAVVGAFQDGVDHGVPVRFRHLEQVLVAGEAGVVDQDVDAAVGARCLVGHGPHLAVVADVQHGADGLEAGFLQAGDSLAHGVGVDVGDHDARAFARQRQGRGVADAAAGSGDDGDFAGELQIHVSVPFSWPRGGLAASASAVLIIRDAE